MFTAVFEKYVFDSDRDDPHSRFAILNREELLSFAPPPGLEMKWPLQRSQKVIVSSWNTETQQFCCRLEDEYVANSKFDSLDFDEVIDRAPEKGWKVVSMYPAQKSK